MEKQSQGPPGMGILWQLCPGLLVHLQVEHPPL
jgi:hypothetical protein